MSDISRVEPTHRSDLVSFGCPKVIPLTELASLLSTLTDDGLLARSGKDLFFEGGTYLTRQFFESAGGTGDGRHLASAEALVLAPIGCWIKAPMISSKSNFGPSKIIERAG